MKKYLPGLLLCLLFTMGVHAQSKDLHQFQFKGFKLFLKDMATDGADNIMFIGSIEPNEKDSTLRDTMMNRIFCRYYSGLYDYQSIVIITDHNFRIRKIDNFGPDHTDVVTYDKKTKQFIIAGHYDQYKPKSYEKDYFIFIAAINPAEGKWSYGSTLLGNNFVTRDINLTDNNYVVNMVVDSMVNNEKMRLPAIVSLGKKVVRTKEGYPTFKLNSFQYAPVELSPYVEISGLTLDGSSHYFSACGYDKGYGIQDIKVFEYANNTFLDRQFYPFDNRMYLYNFKRCIDGRYFFCYNSYLSEKYFDLCKTDNYYRQKWKIRVNSNDYPHFTHHILEMPAGEIVVPLVNEKQEWIFNVYGLKGELLKTIDAHVTAKAYISALKVADGNSFFGLFTAIDSETVTIVRQLSIN